MSNIDPQTRLDDKRDIPPFIQKLLELDVNLSKKFISFMLNFVPIRSLKTHCKFLEISCHGIVWLVVWLAFCWILDNPNLYEMQINMLFGLIIDIILIAFIKAATRRRRPTVNDDPFSIGPDKFSFPSGHASRAFFVVTFFFFLYPISCIFWPPLLAWASCVALSRLLMYRHHILDVVVGVLLGIFEGLLLGLLWINHDIALSIMKYISDDKYVEGQTGI